MNIEWKPTFISTYSVSNTGILRNKRGIYPKITQNGMVYLHDQFKNKYYLPIWVLVAHAFLPESDSQILEHIDGDSSNNRVDNLRYY